MSKVQTERLKWIACADALTRQIEPYMDAKIVRDNPTPRVMGVKWGEMIETPWDADALRFRIVRIGRTVTFDVECWDEEQAADQRDILLAIAEFLNRGSKDGT